MRINITKLVKSILEDNPKARDDDYLLWQIVLRRVQYCDLPDYMNMPVWKFLECAKFMKFPHYETVSRARRKVQENYPELRASAETQAARSELEEKYREYAKTDV